MVPYKPRRRHGSRPKLRGTHFADEVDYDEDFDSADEDDWEEETFEKKKSSDDDEIEFVQDEGQAEEPEESDEDSEASSGLELNLKEAWAAGWRAKNKVAAQKKARQWSKPQSGEKGAGKKKPIPAASDPRKKGCVCSSCGKTGHWKGDPECENVQSGKDPMHKPDKPRKASAKRGPKMFGSPKRQIRYRRL